MKKLINTLFAYLFGTLRVSSSDEETDNILKAVEEGRYLTDDDMSHEKKEG